MHLQVKEPILQLIIRGQYIKTISWTELSRLSAHFHMPENKLMLGARHL